MGMFLSLSGVIGKTQSEVAVALKAYAQSKGGDLQKENIPEDHDNCCVIQEQEGNTTIDYPDHYLEWDDCAQFISLYLKVPIFSFHIHDGDLWMYILFANGTVADQFNPLPDYWKDISDEERNEWKGNADIVAKYISYIKPEDIENYLIPWDDEEDESKAYSDDEYGKEDWQLLDFMRKLKLPYRTNEEGNAEGDTYKLWTSELKLSQKESSKEIMPGKPSAIKSKPWWKFWQ